MYGLCLIARIHPWVSASASKVWSGGGVGQLANSIEGTVTLWHLKSGGTFSAYWMDSRWN